MCLSPVWTSICDLMLPFCAAEYMHSWHLKGFSPVWVSKCLSIVLLFEAEYEHSLHLNGFSPWWVSRCFFNLLLSGEEYEHKWQLKQIFGFIGFLLILLTTMILFLIVKLLPKPVLESAIACGVDNSLFWISLVVFELKVVGLDSHSIFIFGNTSWSGSGLIVKLLRVKLFTLSNWCWVKLFVLLYFFRGLSLRTSLFVAYISDGSKMFDLIWESSICFSALTFCSWESLKLFDWKWVVSFKCTRMLGNTSSWSGSDLIFVTHISDGSLLNILDVFWESSLSISMLTFCSLRYSSY